MSDDAQHSNFAPSGFGFGAFEAGTSGTGGTGGQRADGPAKPPKRTRGPGKVLAKAPKAKPTATQVDASGLRYVRKESGSIFVANPKSFTGKTLSCFYCGTHRSSTERLTQKILGKNQQVCRPLCTNNPVAKRQARLAAEELAAAAVTGQAVEPVAD